MNLQQGFAFAIGLLATACAEAALTTPAEPPPKISLVVADKHCSALVQPYDMQSSVKELTGQMITRGVERVTGIFTRHLTGEDDKAKDKKDTQGITEEARNDAKRLNWLPFSAEVMYGERSHEAVKDDILPRDAKKAKPLYDTADDLLKQISAQVEGQHPYHFQVFIIKTASQNATARPGGFLYLDKGLLDDPKHLLKARFALAHEISHVLQRHETKELQGMIVDSFTAKDEMKKAIAHAKDDPAALLRNVKVGKDIYVRHEIDQELQADSCAARLLNEAYQTPSELAKTIDAFIKQLPPPKDEAVAATAPTTPASLPPNVANSLTASNSEATTKGAKVVQATAVAYSIATTPMESHPSSKERTENLLAMVQELASYEPAKTIAVARKTL